MIDCPSCGKKKEIVEKGKYICSSCDTKFTVDEKGNTAIVLNNKPIITISIIILCSIVFVLTLLNTNYSLTDYSLLPKNGIEDSYLDIDYDNFSYEKLINNDYTKKRIVPKPGYTTLYRALTYIFVHINLAHLFINMLILGMFGKFVEQKMKSLNFLLFFIFTGYIAGLFVSLISKNPTIGASGAIFGVILAYAWFFPHQELYIHFLYKIPARYAILILVLLETLYILGSNDDGISHEGHLLGIMSSLILLLVFYNKERRLFKKRPE